MPTDQHKIIDSNIDKISGHPLISSALMYILKLDFSDTTESTSFKNDYFLVLSNLFLSKIRTDLQYLSKYNYNLCVRASKKLLRCLIDQLALDILSIDDKIITIDTIFRLLSDSTDCLDDELIKVIKLKIRLGRHLLIDSNFAERHLLIDSNSAVNIMKTQNLLSLNGSNLSDLSDSSIVSCSEADFIRRMWIEFMNSDGISKIITSIKSYSLYQQIAEIRNDFFQNLTSNDYRCRCPKHSIGQIDHKLFQELEAKLNSLVINDFPAALSQLNSIILTTSILKSKMLSSINSIVMDVLEVLMFIAIKLFDQQLYSDMKSSTCLFGDSLVNIFESLKLLDYEFILNDKYSNEIDAVSTSLCFIDRCELILQFVSFYYSTKYSRSNVCCYYCTSKLLTCLSKLFDSCLKLHIQHKPITTSNFQQWLEINDHLTNPKLASLFEFVYFIIDIFDCKPKVHQISSDLEISSVTIETSDSESDDLYYGIAALVDKQPQVESFHNFDHGQNQLSQLHSQIEQIFQNLLDQNEDDIVQTLRLCLSNVEFMSILRDKFAVLLAEVLSIPRLDDYFTKWSVQISLFWSILSYHEQENFLKLICLHEYSQSWNFTASKIQLLCFYNHIVNRYTPNGVVDDVSIKLELQDVVNQKILAIWMKVIESMNVVTEIPKNSLADFLTIEHIIVLLMLFHNLNKPSKERILLAYIDGMFGHELSITEGNCWQVAIRTKLRILLDILIYCFNELPSSLVNYIDHILYNNSSEFYKFKSEVSKCTFVIYCKPHVYKCLESIYLLDLKNYANGKVYFVDQSLWSILNLDEHERISKLVYSSCEQNAKMLFNSENELSELARICLCICFKLNFKLLCLFDTPRQTLMSLSQFDDQFSFSQLIFNVWSLATYAPLFDENYKKSHPMHKVEEDKIVTETIHYFRNLSSCLKLLDTSTDNFECGSRLLNFQINVILFNLNQTFEHNDDQLKRLCPVIDRYYTHYSHELLKLVLRQLHSDLVYGENQINILVQLLDVFPSTLFNLLNNLKKENLDGYKTLTYFCSNIKSELAKLNVELSYSLSLESVFNVYLYSENNSHGRMLTLFAMVYTLWSIRCKLVNYTHIPFSFASELVSKSPGDSQFCLIAADTDPATNVLLTHIKKCFTGITRLEDNSNSAITGVFCQFAINKLKSILNRVTSNDQFLDDCIKLVDTPSIGQLFDPKINGSLEVVIQLIRYIRRLVTSVFVEFPGNYPTHASSFMHIIFSFLSAFDKFNYDDNLHTMLTPQPGSNVCGDLVDQICKLCSQLPMIDAYIDKCIEIKDSKINSSIHVADKIRKQFPHSISKYLQTKLISGIKSQNNNLVMSERFINCSWILFNLCYDESTIIQLVDVIEFTCYKNLPSNLLNEFNPGYKHAFKMYIGLLQALMNIPYSCHCFNFESLESKYRKLENRIYQNKISNILSGALKCQMARQINTEQKNLGEKQVTFTDDCQSRPLFALLPSELESSSTDFVWYNVCETDEFIRKVEKKVKSIFTTKDTIEQIYKRFTIDGISKEVEMINRFCTQYDDLHNISDKSINIQQGPLIDENVYNNLDQFGHQIEEIHKCPLFCFGTKYNHNLKHSVNFLLTVLNLNNPSYGGQSNFDIKFTFLKLHQILNDASFNEGDTLITKEVYSKRIPGIVKEINYSTRGDCKCALVCTKDFCEFDLESDVGVQIKSWSSDFVLTVDIKNDWTIDIIDVCMDATKVCWLPYPFVMAYITTTGNLVIKKYDISNTFEEQIFEPPYCIIDATFCQIDSQRFENESKHLCGDVVIFLLEKYGSVYYVNLSRFNRNLSNINDDYSISNKIDFYHEECAKISTLHYCHQLNYLFVTCVMTRTVAWRVRFLTELVFEPIVDVSNDSLSIIPNLSITSFDLSPNLYGLKLCEVYRSTEFITAVMHIDADHFFIEYLPGDCNVRLYPTYDESKAFIVTQTHVNPEEPCFTISTIKRKFFPVYYRTQSALFENFFLIKQQQNLAYGSPLTKYMKHHIFTEIEVTSKDLMEIYPMEMINTAISNFTNIRHSKDFVVNLLMKKKPSDTLILELKANQLYSKLIPNCVVIQNDCFVIKPFDNYADIVLGPEHETSKHINLEIKIRNPEQILKLAMLDGVSVYERRFLDVCKSLSDISLYPCEYLHSSDYQVSVHSHCPCESYLSYIIEIITMKLSLFYTANTDLQVIELDLMTQVLNHVVAQYHSPSVLYSTVNLLSLLGIEISSNFYFKLVHFDQSNNTSPMISILAMMLIHSEVDNNVVSKFASKMTNEQYNDFVKYLKKELLSYPSSFLAIIPGNAYLLTGNEMSFNCYCGYLFAMLNKLSLILDSDKEDELHKTFDFSDFIVNNLIFNMIKEDKCFYPYIMLLNNILTLGAYPEISLSIDKFAIETNVAFDEIEEISESKKAYERFNTLVFLENAGHIYDFSNLTLTEDVNVDTSVALTDPSVVHDHTDYNFFTVNENVYDVVDDVNDDTIIGDDNSTTTIENDTNNLNFVCKAMYLNNDSIQTNSITSEEIKRLLEFPYRLLTLILDRLYDVINTKNKLLTAKQLYTIFNTLFDIWGYFWCNAIKLNINDTSLSSLVNNIVYRIIQMIASGTLKLDLETVTSKIPDSDIFVICFFTMIFSERINRDLRRSERIKTIQTYSNYFMDLFCIPSFQKTVFSVIFFDHRSTGFKRDEINNDLKDIQSNFNLVEYLSPDFCWNDYKGCTLDGSMVIYDLRWETFQALYMRMFTRNLKCIYGQSGKIPREFLKNNEFMSLLRNAYGL